MVEKSYKGPHIAFPLTKRHVEQMIEAFKQKKVYTEVILAKRVLSTAAARQVCVTNTARRQIGSKRGAFRDQTVNSH